VSRIKQMMKMIIIRRILATVAANMKRTVLVRLDI
jgi:hypothetical protein